MSEEMNQSTVDSYLPATLVGKHFGYTKDYILMLIKQGKIDGKKIGNKWHASMSSAETYFTQASNLIKRRRKQLSLERKIEFNNYQRNHNVRSTSMLRETESLIRSHKYRNIALMETCAIVFFAVFMGTFGKHVIVTAHSLSNHNSSNFVDNTAMVVHSMFHFDQSRAMYREQVIPNSMSEHQTRKQSFPAAVMLSQDHTKNDVTDTQNRIQDVFSDDTWIEPDINNTFIVTPKFIDGVGEEQRFKLIPIQ